MSWVIEKAKNGIDTLKVNGIYIYSKYNPMEDTKRFIETLEKQDFYVVFGLGLGYHIQLISERFPESEIFGFPLSDDDLNIFRLNGNIKHENFRVIFDINEIELNEENLVIPMQWTKALGDSKLIPLLEDIKLRQLSRDQWIEKLNENFQYTLSLPQYDVAKLKGTMKGKTVCIVASGPSLNETVEYLKQCKNKCFILGMNSSLKLLMEHGIRPDALVVSDGKAVVKHQISNIDINVPMFCLSTASMEALEYYKGIKIKVYQKGYELAEQQAALYKQPLFDIGGSVATFAFALATFLGFDNIILFGQDLGFRNNRTHANSATSGVQVNQPYKYKKLLANDGEMNNVSRSLHLFWRWFNTNVPLAKAKVYNTALQGTAIANAAYISPEKLMMLVEANDEIDFEQIILEHLEEL